MTEGHKRCFEIETGKPMGRLGSQNRKHWIPAVIVIQHTLERQLPVNHCYTQQCILVSHFYISLFNPGDGGLVEVSAMARGGLCEGPPTP